jgi:hypothetical protein
MMVQFLPLALQKIKRTLPNATRGTFPCNPDRDSLSSTERRKPLPARKSRW